MRVRVSIALLTVAAVSAALVPASAVTAGPGTTVVVAGLDNPRQLSLTDDGDLLIAEAGHGAADPSRCVGEVCVGTTGAVSKVRHPSTVSGGTPQRVVTGLLSQADPTGFGAVGPNGVSAGKGGTVYVLMTTVPTEGDADLPAWQSGNLLRVDRRDRVARVADISAFEDANDPDGEGIESNPYAVLALPGRELVADAAGDSIVEVRGSRTRLFAVLPDPGPDVDPVPTSIAVGRDGQIYVGELHSFVPGQARVQVYSPGGRLRASIGRFTTVHGLAIDRRGNLYVSELYGGPACNPAEPTSCGQVTKVRPDGSRTSVAVPLPAGVAVDRTGAVYVAAWSIMPATGGGVSGQVWRVRF